MKRNLTEFVLEIWKLDAPDDAAISVLVSKYLIPQPEEAFKYHPGLVSLIGGFLSLYSGYLHFASEKQPTEADFADDEGLFARVKGDSRLESRRFSLLPPLLAPPKSDEFAYMRYNSKTMAFLTLCALAEIVSPDATITVFGPECMTYGDGVEFQPIPEPCARLHAVHIDDPKTGINLAVNISGYDNPLQVASIYTTKKIISTKFGRDTYSEDSTRNVFAVHSCLSVSVGVGEFNSRENIILLQPSKALPFTHIIINEQPYPIRTAFNLEKAQKLHLKPSPPGPSRNHSGKKPAAKPLPPEARDISEQVLARVEALTLTLIASLRTSPPTQKATKQKSMLKLLQPAIAKKRKALHPKPHKHTNGLLPPCPDPAASGKGSGPGIFTAEGNGKTHEGETHKKVVGSGKTHTKVKLPAIPSASTNGQGRRPSVP
jgi:hypothetical protein